MWFSSSSWSFCGSLTSSRGSRPASSSRFGFSLVALLRLLRALCLHRPQQLPLGQRWAALAGRPAPSASPTTATAAATVGSATGTSLFPIIHFERIDQRLQAPLRLFLKTLALGG